jgi:nitroimidazol reductase NimA-like FMN-containing flavoprotein (pyridoxamine 5'-phosphate oxidase superfamily)
MRRQDRAIAEIGEILSVIDRCKVCRLGLSVNSQPYVVPLNFGYTFTNNALTLFFHSAHEGRKIDMIKQNNRACFEMDCDHELLEAESACGHSFAFSSIIGFGTIAFIETVEGKIRALNLLMKHQTGKDIQHRYSEAQLDAVCVYRMNVTELTGKRKSK